MEPLKRLQALIDKASTLEVLPIPEVSGTDPLARLQALMSGHFEVPARLVSDVEAEVMPSEGLVARGAADRNGALALLGEFVLRGLKHRPLAGEQRERAVYLLSSYMEERGEREEPGLRELLEILIFDDVK